EARDIFATIYGPLDRSDVHAHGPTRVRRGERAGDGRVQPIVCSTRATVVRDAISVDVTVRLHIRDSAVVEVVRHWVERIRHTVPVCVWRRRSVPAVNFVRTRP